MVMKKIPFASIFEIIATKPEEFKSDISPKLNQIILQLCLSKDTNNKKTAREILFQLKQLKNKEMNALTNEEQEAVRKLARS